MPFLIFKYVITAAIIVVASEIAKRSDKIGALIISLPLMTLMTLVWLFVEKQADSKIANHAWYTFWYVIPTLPMFLVFPWLLQRWGFLVAMAGLISGSGLLLVSFALLVRRFGIHLW